MCSSNAKKDVNDNPFVNGDRRLNRNRNQPPANSEVPGTATLPSHGDYDYNSFEDGDIEQLSCSQASLDSDFSADTESEGYQESMHQILAFFQTCTDALLLNWVSMVHMLIFVPLIASLAKQIKAQEACLQTSDLSTPIATPIPDETAAGTSRKAPCAMKKAKPSRRRRRKVVFRIPSSDERISSQDMKSASRCRAATSSRSGRRMNLHRGECTQDLRPKLPRRVLSED